MDTQPEKKSSDQFYRRVLPSFCISFHSEEGKQLFKEALSDGNMECYFKLAAQFRTQDEPAFCGLSTLVMVLNALEVDPGQVWKGPWRWYHENMLECCVPLDVMTKRGTNIDEYICIALCNSLEVNATRAENSSLESFRRCVIEYSKREDAFLTLSYSRGSLGQTGDGHFSPMAGYHSKSDMVLMMDTARFKYPPHWISVPRMWEAMKLRDQETGKSRGFIALSRVKPAPNTIPCLHFAGTLSFLRTPNHVSLSLEQWTLQLHESILKTFNTEEFTSTVTTQKLTHRLLRGLGLQSNCYIENNTCSDIENVCDIPNKDKDLSKYYVLREIESLELFALVQDSLNTSEECGKQCTKNRRRKQLDGLGWCNKYTKAHAVTALLLCFPFENCHNVAGSVGQYLGQTVERSLARIDSQGLLNEISMLKQKLSLMLKSSTKDLHQKGISRM